MKLQKQFLGDTIGIIFSIIALVEALAIIPAASQSNNGLSTVDCNFDNSTLCHWETSTFGLYKFTFRSTQFSDHTKASQQGHPLTAASGFIPRNTVLYLISPFLPTFNSSVCFTFWYHVNKASFSDLSLSVVKQNMTLNIWLVNNELVNSWRVAGVNLPVDAPFQLMFNVTVGHQPDGDVGLDDIKLNTGSCIRKNVFDFESGYQDFTRMYDNSFDWQLKVGHETDAKIDHTYFSSYGKLLCTDTRNQTEGATSSVVSPTFSPAHEECLFFWYIKLGSRQSSFQVFINQMIQGAGLELQTVWGTNEPTTEWTRVYLDITSLVPYRIVFQVMAAANSSVDEVFLDDMSFSTVPCPQSIDCDFERSFLCGYQSSMIGDIFWYVIHANDPSSIIPVDHTTQAELGSYMQVDFPDSLTTKMTVELISQPIIMRTNSCLTLWYTSKGTGNFRIFSNSQEGKNLLLLKAIINDLKGKPERIWHYLETDITNVTNIRNITFQIEGFPWSSFAIDDIKAVPGACKDLNNDAQENRTPARQSLDSSNLITGCDFEAGTLCSFTLEQPTYSPWQIFSHNTSHSSGTGLDFDHTLNSKYGKHIYVNALGNMPSSVARIVSPPFKNYSVCISFWYGMSGLDVNRLSVYIRHPHQYDSIFWTRTGNQGKNWHHRTLQVDAIFDSLGVMVPTQVVFDGTIGSSAASDLDLDDIRIYSQSCPPSDICDFEDSTSCYLDQDNMDTADWMLNKKAGEVNAALGMSSDHTFQTGEGHYAYINLLYGTSGTARIITAMMSADSVQCLNFWYFISSLPYLGRTNTLKVFVRDERGIETILASFSGTEVHDWTPAHVMVSLATTEKIQILFEADVSSNGAGIGLDDIQFSTDECFKAVNCQFHSGSLCNWHQDDRNPTPPWEVFHNDQDTEEYYMKAHFSDWPYGRLQVSTVLSDIIPATGLDDFCFRFRYKMQGNNAGFLNVSVIDAGNSEVILFSVYGHLNNSQWQTAYAQKPDNFNASLFQFSISATTVNNTSPIPTNGMVLNGDVFVTDIQLSPEKCEQEKNSTFVCSNGTMIELSKVCDFKNDCPGPTFDDETNCVNCNFESGLCMWEDDSSGSNHFMLGLNLSSDHQPEHQHGSDGGNYLFIGGTPDTSQEHIDLLLTQELGPSPPSCLLNFHYYMNSAPGIALGDLLVVLEESDEVTILWRGLRIHSPEWHEVVVPIDNIHSRFKIHFRVKKLAYLQYIAIDDIKLQGCVFKEPTLTSCQDANFRCNTSGACIDSILLCNFDWDCFDGSDESDALCSNYTMDDFEYSLGNWLQSSEDDLDWSRLQGQGVELYNGPRRDHTLGTHFGHYMLFEASGHRSGQKAQLLSPVFLPSQKDCWMTFVVYLYGTTSADLRVTTRTTRHGAESVILEITDSFDNTWQYKRVQLQSTENFQVVIEGVTSGIMSLNIGIDDISFSPQCQVSDVQTLPEGAPVSLPPSLCHSNQFQCNGGNVQCVSQSQVCDFIAQCEDHSDERECGSCTFEMDQCGWHDESIGNMMWSEVKAGSKGSPLSDHTYSVPGQGTYLSVVDGLGDARLPAVLVGPTLLSTGADCSMNVYIFKESGHVNGSIEFGLRSGTDPFKSIRTSATVNFGAGHFIGRWIKYSYHIGALPPGFQAFVRAINVTSDQLGMAFDLDDITFENCQENVTSNITGVSCDFENGWCGYFNDYTLSGEWLLANKDPTISRVGPDHDHTTGSGYFAYISLEKGYTYQAVSARLITGLLDPSSATNSCLSFFYHTFGTNIRLEVFLVEGTVSRLIFIQSDTKNSWQFAQASVLASSIFQIAFVGTGTKVQYYGHIAIDDITLDTTACLPTMSCNFDTDLCGYTQSSSDQFDWSRIQSGFVREGEPTMDHTTSDHHGHYIVMRSAGQKPGDRAELVSPMFSGQPGSKCLSFWYFVELGKNSSMEIFYWPDGSPGAKSSIWTSIGSFPSWMFGQTTLNVTDNFKISFDGIVAPVSATSYCLDDVVITDGQCISPGSCDFETSTCGFTEDQFIWIRNRGQMGPGVPSVDHTTGTSRGFFISNTIKSSYSGSQFELRSQWLNGSGPMCLSFWYFVSTGSVQAYNIEVLTALTDDPLKRQSVYKLNNLQSDEWLKVKVNFTMLDNFYFVISATYVKLQEASISLDDILLSLGSCEDRILTTIPPPQIYTFPPTKFDCSDFQSLCQWGQGSNNDFDWMITSKSPMKFSGTVYDHTTENEQGSFIMINPPRLANGLKGQLVSPPLDDLTKGLCFKFWYFMSGPSVGSLNLRLMKDFQGFNSTLLWHRDGEQSEEWQRASLFITPGQLTTGHPQIVNIILEYVSASEFPNDMRIDDISANYGPCAEDLTSCDFESEDLCGFSQDPVDNGDWLLSSGTKATNVSFSGPLVDHTYGSPFGHYLCVHGSSLNALDRVGIKSTTLGPIKNSCLKFFYHMYGDLVGTLAVKIFTEEGDVTLVWSSEGNSGDIWRSAHAILDSNVNFQIAFEAVMKNGAQGYIAIDDISILDTPCPRPATCDFEMDLCSFQNVKEVDDFDWLRHNGPTLNEAFGPSRDHTTNTSNGHYIYTLNVLRHRGKSARLMSEMLPATDGSCLSFYYYMQGQGNLLVWQDLELYHLVAENTGDVWKQKFINFTSDTDFVIYFESQILMEGQADTAIDDVSYTQGLCSTAEESQQFVCPEDKKVIPIDKKCNFVKDCVNGTDEMNCGNCNFQFDKCGYKDISSGSFHWMLASNHTMRSSTLTSGLGFDHTENSPYGNMLYVDSAYGRDMTTAIIESPQLHESYQSCKLQFFYKFSMPLSGEISVGLKFDWSTGIFPTSFSQNRVYNLDSWHMAEVDIGYVAESFYIVFMARKSYMSQGTMAIDDISLIDCGPPPATTLGCNQKSSFKCGNGHCIDQKVVCDLAQDCGDSSDEAVCQDASACSFENSMCDWQQESRSGMSWKIGSGISRNPISRDHTTGMASGHYLYLSYTSWVSSMAYSTARLVSPVFQATTTSNKTCQLTLYFYMGKNINNSFVLNVNMKTAEGSYETKLFSRQRGDFSYWERYVIPIISSTNFLIVVESVPGTGAVDQAILALDDLVFSPGCLIIPVTLPTAGYTPTTQPVTTNKCAPGQHQCPDGQCIIKAFVCDLNADCSDGSDEVNCGPCEFETGTCGWYSASTGQLDWSLSSPQLMGKVGPAVDVTFKTSNGHYLYVKTAYGLGDSQAMIMSGPLPPITSTCSVTLQYYVNSTVSGNLGVSTYYQGVTMPLITINVAAPDPSGWQIRTFGFTKAQPEGSQIVLNFGANNISGSQNIAAVDSIQFHACSKQKEFVNLDCNFDLKDLCNWRQSTQDVFDWVFSGSDVLTINGPRGDYSSTGSGYYLLAKSQNRHSKDTAGILSPLLPPNQYDGHCLSFWYFMNGEDVGSLRVETYSDQTNFIFFERLGSQPDRWIQALVPVKSMDIYTVGIKAEVTGGLIGDIAIDDIKLTPGPCSLPDECMFEDNNMCDWYENAGDKIYWMLGSASWGMGMMPNTDHTLQTSLGHFAYITTEQTGNATLRSVLRSTGTSNTSLCFQLWYHMMSQKPTQVSLYLTRQDGQKYPLIQIHGPTEDVWRKASVLINNLLGAYELQITATVNGGAGHVAIDDLFFQYGHCPTIGSCSFDQDMCGFSSLSRGKDYEWVLHSDDPSNISSNSYLLLQPTNMTSANATAMLLSEAISYQNTSTGARCLQFSAQLVSSGAAQANTTLNIFMRNIVLNTRTLVGSFNAFSLNRWSVYKVSFEVQNDFEFFFEALYGGHLDAAAGLDDINLRDQACDSGISSQSTKQWTSPTSGDVTDTESSVPVIATTNKCPETIHCHQHDSTKCVHLCDGVRDCTNGFDETNCGLTSSMPVMSSTIQTSTSLGHVTNQQSKASDSSDSWKLPVGIVLGLLFVAIISMVIILVIRHRRKIPFEPLENNQASKALSNPAYLYDQLQQGMTSADDPEVFPGFEEIAGSKNTTSTNLKL